MQPLSSMTHECASIRGLVFDVDDTVTRNGRVEREAFDALWDLAGAGYKLVVVTGRPLGWTDVIAAHWPVDVAVGENGAGWCFRKPGVERTEGYIADDATRAKQQVVLDRISSVVAREFPDIARTRDNGARRCDLAFDIGEHARVAPSRIDALAACIVREGAQPVISSVHAHVQLGAWDKAVGACAAVRDVLGLDLESERERWVFIGDSGNDAAAFEWFPITVGVANVQEHLARLTTPPRYVTTADRGRGFAELARHLLARRR